MKGANFAAGPVLFKMFPFSPYNVNENSLICLFALKVHNVY